MMWRFWDGDNTIDFLAFHSRHLFLICMGILGVFPTFDAGAQTLKEALTAAYMQNPTLLGQRANLRAADEKVPQALSNWRPNVSFTGSAGGSSVMTSTIDGVDRRQHREPKSIGVSVTQDIYRGGRTSAETNSAENTVQAERARLMKKEQDFKPLPRKSNVCDYCSAKLFCSFEGDLCIRRVC